MKLDRDRNGLRSFVWDRTWADWEVSTNGHWQKNAFSSEENPCSQSSVENRCSHCGSWRPSPHPQDLDQGVTHVHKTGLHCY